ncbi:MULTISPECIES: RagB/SusD family nutrient uptake outer membrane protein [unclassified Carboxylicivirga]|uniref:RagB/SusD family nutrient uptake outer membrane protein n=1 Tax=Carboxylicivirga TaxID=1628153 RepID=UPI003D338937
MKKYIIYLFSLSLILSSCTDMLDIEPENSITHYNYFKSEKDLMSLTYSMQNQLKEAYFSNMRIAERGMVQAHPNQLPKQIDYQLILKIAQWSGIERDQHWGYYYKVIATANLIIENVDAVPMEDKRKEFYKGVALFTRGFSYFNLVRSFGDCIYITEVDDIESKKSTPWRHVLDLAIADVEESAKYLDIWSKQVDEVGAALITRQIPGVGAAYAVLAHMHAWMATFGGQENEYLEKAIEYTNLVINGDERGPEFGLESNYEDVCQQSMIGKGSEVVYLIDTNHEDGLYLFEIQGLTLIDDYTAYPVEPFSSPNDNVNLRRGITNAKVAELYPDRDARAHSYFYKYGQPDADMNALDLAYVYKRRDPLVVFNPNYNSDRYVRTKGDYPVFRLSGIILLRAELLALAGQDGAAIEDLNTIRIRAGIDVFNSGNEILEDAIFRERERELLLEGHRYFDILRGKRYFELLHGDIKDVTEQDVEDGALFFPYNIHATYNNTLLKQMPFWSKYF